MVLLKQLLLSNSIISKLQLDFVPYLYGSLPKDFPVPAGQNAADY